MSKHNNRSSRKSQSLRSSNIPNKKQSTKSEAEANSIDKETSAVGVSEQNDMSWAEEYADDNRNGNDVSSESTRVVIPKKKTDSSSADGQESVNVVNVEDTLTFRKASDASETDAECEEELNEESNTEGTVLQDTSDDSKPQEQFEVKEELTADTGEDEDDDWDGQFKIRDAVTDKTIVSFGEAQAVRQAASQLQMDDDWMADSKIRDAVTDNTIVSLGDAQAVRSAASQLQLDDDWMADSKIRDAVTDKTIVSLNEAQAVRSAAAGIQPEGDWNRPARIRDSVQGSGNKQDVPTEYFENPAADEDASLTRVFKVAKARDSKKPDTQVESKTPKKSKASGKSSSKESEDILIKEASADNQRKKEQLGNTRRTQVKDSIYGEQRKLYSDRDKINEKYIRNSRTEAEKRSDRYAEPEYSRYEEQRSRRANNPVEQNRYDRSRRQSQAARYDYDERPVRRQRNSYDDHDYRRRSRNDEEYYYREAKSPLRFIPLVLVIAICVLGFMAARQIAYDVPVNSADYSKYNYTITADSTNESVASDLLELGLIDNALIYRIRCILYSANYKEGTYVLSPCYSTEKIINILSGYEYGSD